MAYQDRQHLRQHGDGQDLAQGRAEPIALGGEQREPEQDERRGHAGTHAGQIDVAGGLGRRRVFADQDAVDAKVEPVEILDEARRAEHHEGDGDQPGNRPKPSKCQPDQRGTGGQHGGGGVRREAMKIGQNPVERRQRDVPTDERQGPDGAHHEAADARHVERHPHGAWRRQRHLHRNLNHEPSSPNIAEFGRGRSWALLGRRPQNERQ